MSDFKTVEFGYIPIEWDFLPLSKLHSNEPNAIAMGPFGSNIKAENFVDFGVPVIRGSNLNTHKFVTGNYVFLTEEKADELSSSNCKENDLVFTHRGTIGQVALIPKDEYPRYVISQSGMKFSPDKTKIDPDFLFYFFVSKYGQYQILKYESQVGVPSISNPLTSLKEIEIPLPPLPEQKAIASVLSDLDDKIDLLHRQNETLEALAQTLFRQWFIEEAKDNWEKKELIYIADHIRENIKPYEKPTEFFYHYSIPSYDDGRNPVIEKGSKILSNKYLVKPGAILISKLNPRFPRVWPIPDKIEENSICSTELQVVLPKRKEYYPFIYCFLRSKDLTDNLVSFASGTSGSHQRVKPDDIFNSTFLYKSENQMFRFYEVASELIKKTFINRDQIQTLENLRDLLLPKLISGEVRVRYDQDH